MTLSRYKSKAHPVNVHDILYSESSYRNCMAYVKQLVRSTNKS